ncbi:MAG TPA: type VI secretion system protein TssA, partial [Pyrinomonadaceae bacterium]|nr:type VI secretion system protein TssA [Pyrinomonadaceae bacterium]
DHIREARRADDQLAQGEWKRENKLADWLRVVQLASEALATQTKDLRIGAWLAEALVQLHGFTGLRDGLKIMRGLQENFWADLYPEIEDDDLDARANALSWLDQHLALALKRVPITEGTGGLRYAYHQWEESQAFDIPADTGNLDSAELERLNDLRVQAADEDKITSEQWRAAKNTTGRRFYEETFAVLGDCWKEFQALDAVMDEKFERQSPGLRALQVTLEDLLALVERIVREKRVLEPDADVALVGDGNQTSLPVDGDGHSRAPSAMQLRGSAGLTAASRQEAYQKLAEAAAYFREAEPHSPVSYLVERAIRWGQMPLDSWLAEVVKSEEVLSALRETLGIKHQLYEEPVYNEPSYSSEEEQE